MKKSILLATVLIGSAGVLLLTGCVYRERVVYAQPGAPVVAGEVYVTAAPPPPIVETTIVAPGPGFVWIGGCWEWRSRWVWTRGHWARPPHRGAVWVGHRYDPDRHVFIRGGWR